MNEKWLIKKDLLLRIGLLDVSVWGEHPPLPTICLLAGRNSVVDISVVDINTMLLYLIFVNQ